MPTIATHVAVHSSVNSGNAAARAAAAQARRDACTVLVRDFQHEGATVAEIRQYSSCARILYPEPTSPANLFAGKLIVAFVLLCFVVGVARFRSRRESFDTWADALIIGGLGGVLAAGGICVLAASICFVVSA